MEICFGIPSPPPCYITSVKRLIPIRFLAHLLVIGTAGWGCVSEAVTQLDEQAQECIDSGGFWNCIGATCGKNSSCSCDERPTCEPTDDEQRVCGCDGAVQENETCAAAAGVSLNREGACHLDAGDVACGFLVCDQRSTFCEESWTDRPVPSSYACPPLPAACEDLSADKRCECIRAEDESLSDCEISDKGTLVTRRYL
jgi:hypothetical protein